MKPITKIVIHSVIVLPMDGIIVKIDYSPLFAGDPTLKTTSLGYNCEFSHIFNAD